MKRDGYDVIVVGGGHNGLVTAGYLARAGRRVLVLERRPVVGGACVTEEVFPGFRVSTAAYLCSLLQPQIIRDLKLADFGFEILPKDPVYFSPFPDGRHLFFWRDESKTLQEIARFSVRDAERYPHYQARLERLADFIEPLLLKPPPELFDMKPRDLFEVGRLGLRGLRLDAEDRETLVRILLQSVADFLGTWFRSEAVKVSLATDGVIGTNGGPFSPGTAYVLLHHCMGRAGGERGVWGFVRGGMGTVSRALADSACSRGAEIRTEAAVSRISVRDGRVTGVVLETGETVSAPVVASGLDPKRTFLELIDPAHLDGDFRKRVERIRMEGSSFKLNLALSGLPEFRVFPGSAPGPQHRGTIHLCPSLESMEKAWDDAKFGRPSRVPMVELTIPTVYDPSLAPPGKHILSVFAQYAPYRLAEGSWPEEGPRFVERLLDVIEEYAPNIRRIVEGVHFLSPLDLEEQFGMTGGNIFHGEMSLDQLFSLRPVAGWARYRTPIRNLYLCGSGTHPGGGVMGASGYNAAREILRARRL